MSVWILYHKYMNKFALLIVSSFLISGCAVNQKSGAGPYPENWKSLAMNYIQSNYIDPYSIRDSEISPPFRSNKAFFDSWTICIRNNAKNRFGGYTGRRATDLVVQHGRIVQEDTAPSDCRNVRYEPFPVN